MSAPTTSTAADATARQDGPGERAPRPGSGRRPRPLRTPTRRPARAARSQNPQRRPGTRSQVVTVLLCGAVLLGALLLALWLNIALSRGSYAQHDLSAQQALLDEKEQALTERLQASSAPSVLASRAEEMGMVRATKPGWLVLEQPADQAVVGSPTAATSPTPSAAGTGSTGSTGSADEPLDTDDDTAATPSSGTSATPSSGTGASSARSASPSASGGDR